MKALSTPPDSAIDTVVFDLGGVLIDWDPRHLYRQLFHDHEKMERFLAEICSPEWNAQQDAGRPWHEAISELSARHPGHAALIAAYRARWSEMLGGEITGSVAVLRELRERGLRLYALTNWSHETFPLARQQYPFLRWFEGILVSGEERLIKPDPAIFALLLSRFGITAARAAFIDDAPRNVSAASTAGLHAIHFNTPAQLRGDLIALGLPLRPS